MASVRNSEIDGHSGLQALHVIASACRGFLGPEKSVKLITSPEDDSCEMIFTTHRLLSLLDIEHPSGYLLRDACRSHFKQFGTGCTTLVCMSGAWARAFEILLNEGIPGDAILQYGDEIIKLCLDVCEEEAFNCAGILEALKVPEDKRQVLSENEKYNDQIKISIPCEEKSTKDETFGINHISVLPPKMPHTVDHSRGVIDLSETNKDIDLDLKQALVEDTPSLPAVADTDDVDDVSWYFDSNDDKLEKSRNSSPADHDDKPSPVDNVILDNFETSVSTSCLEDISLESPVNLTAHFERKEESHSSVNEIARIRRSDTNIKSNTNCRNIFSAPLWNGFSAKAAPMTSKNESLVMSCFDGNSHDQHSTASAATDLNNHLADHSNFETRRGDISSENVKPELSRERSYLSHFEDSQWAFESESEDECSQDSRSLSEQDVNPPLAAVKRTQTNVLAEDAALQVKATNFDNKNGIKKENLTFNSLQESRKEIDTCLKNLNISKKTFSSRFPSKKQILRNSRHFQNEDTLSEMKASSELLNNFTTDRGSFSEISSATFRKHSAKLDVHQLDGSPTIEPMDVVSSATKAEAASFLTSLSPAASRTSFESLFDSGAELVQGSERKAQQLSQPLNRIFTNPEVSHESLDYKIKSQTRTDHGLNGVYSVKGNHLDACVIQNAEMLCTSQKMQRSTNAVDTHTGEPLTKAFTSSSPSKTFEKKSDNTVSSKMVTSEVSCCTATVNESIPDFKRLCEGLSHGAGTCMCLARDVFIKNLQSGQFEDPYICRVQGPTSDRSTVIDGLVISCDMKLMTLASTLRGKPLKAVLINGDLTKNYRHAGYKGPFEVKVVVDSVNKIPNSSQDVWLKRIMDKIRKFRISLVLVKGHMDASLADQCMGCGTLIIPRVPYSALQYLSSNTNTSMNSYFRDISQEDICEGLYLDCWEAGWEATIRSLHTQRTTYVRLWGPCDIQTAMICAPSKPQLQSQEEKFMSSYHKLKDVLRTGLVCPGMGATEIKVMRRLEEFQASIMQTSSENLEDSLKRKVAGAFQAGFEEFIIWLVQNSRDITKFDVKSCIYDLVSSRSVDPELIQENLFPKCKETEAMWNVFMESCRQIERKHMFGANNDKRDSYFNRFGEGFCTSAGKDQTVLLTDGISQTDTTSTGNGSEGSSQISRLVVFDCFSSKSEAWQSAWSLIKLVMNIDSVLTTGLSTNELDSCNNIVL